MLRAIFTLRPGARSRAYGRLYKSSKNEENSKLKSSKRLDSLGSHDGNYKMRSKMYNSSNKTKNFVKKWQAEGDHYIGYDNLVKLDRTLTNYTATRSASEKICLLSELTLTYFARFHNMVRDEFQYEKDAVEARLTEWPIERLTKEGFALLNLAAIPKGYLFQQKVFRFSNRGLGDKLPFHQFSPGDCVKITSDFEDPLMAIEGTVLERRLKHLDICFNTSDAARIDTTLTYRLDVTVNRTAFDRQIEGLQLFLTPSSGRSLGVSRAIRDIILYSYPNSMIQLANTPGGLRMGLPTVDTTRSPTLDPESLGLEDNIDEFQALTAAVEKGLKMTNETRSKRGRGSEDDLVASEYLEQEVMLPERQLQQSIFTQPTQQSLPTESPPVSVGTPFPVVPAEITEPVFATNSRLKNMTETFSGSGPNKTVPHTDVEVDRAVNEITKLCPMNPSQLSAVRKAVTQTVTLVQGPPGTGKTRTACAMLGVIVNLKKQRIAAGGTESKMQKGHKVLACTHSNVAADNLLAGLVAQGVNVIRLGKPVNVRSALWKNTLDARLLQMSEWVAAKKKLESAVNNYTAAASSAEVDGEIFDNIVFRDLTVSKKKFAKMEDECVRSILAEADVIVCTCIGAGSEVLVSFAQKQNVQFSTVLIDEAAQCMESATLPSLVLGCRRLILVGDHNQLPPVVSCPDSLNHGLGVSLFARLAAGGMRPSLLNEQYRMHPKIAEFSSIRFYDGEVQTNISAEDRPIPKGFKWPNPKVPVVFIDVCPDADFNENSQGWDSKTEMNAEGDWGGLNLEDILEEAPSEEEEEGVTVHNEEEIFNGEKIVKPKTSMRKRGYEDIKKKSQNSFSNAAEAEVLMRVVRGLLDKGGLQLGQIGVITPYSAQVRLLTDRFRKAGWLEQVLSREADESLGPSMPNIVRWKRKKRAPTAKTTKCNIFSEEEKMILLGTNTGQLPDKSREELLLRLHSVLRGPSPSPGPVAVPLLEEEEHRKEGGQDVKGETAVSSTPSSASATTCEMYSVPIDEEEDLKQGETEDAVGYIEVRSVDGFQGREKDVVLISSVRSNPEGNIGFLRDWRRLNVAVTRAKSGLIVIGDSSTLRYEKHWKAFVDWCHMEGCYVNQPIQPKKLAVLYASARPKAPVIPPIKPKKWHHNPNPLSNAPIPSSEDKKSSSMYE